MRKFLPFAALAVLSGCATAPAVYQFDNSDVMDADFAETWESTIDYFSSRNIQIRTIERDSGLIYAERMYAGGYDSATGGYADCGSQPMYTPTRSSISFNVFVRSVDEESTRVTVTTSFSQTLVMGSYPPIQVECNSTGLLETSVLRAIKSGT